MHAPAARPPAPGQTRRPAFTFVRCSSSGLRVRASHPGRPGQPMMELSMHERMCRGCMAPSSISSSLPARTAAGRAAGQAQRPGDGEHRLRACSSNITRVGANGRGAFVCAALLFPSALVPPGPPDIRVQTHGRPRPDPDLPAASVRLHACMHHSGALSHGIRCTRT